MLPVRTDVVQRMSTGMAQDRGRGQWFDVIAFLTIVHQLLTT